MKNLISIIQKKLKRGYQDDIDYTTMKKMIKSDPNIVVIDIRPRDEYSYGHLDGAINIPMQEIENKIKYRVQNKSQVIIVYCRYGGRSRKVVNKLRKMGYCNVYNLIGGIESV